MTPRRVAAAFGLLALGASGLYVFVYLYRWEWNRAILSLGLFIAVEVALGVAMLLDRIGRIGATTNSHIDAAVLARIEQAAPEPGKPFAWLDPAKSGTTTSVFVPILMGAGVVLSGIAWLVERIASKTVRPSMEHGLAARLGALTLPDTLVEPDADRRAPRLFSPIP